jgi:hypothetical protein
VFSNNTFSSPAQIQSALPYFGAYTNVVFRGNQLTNGGSPRYSATTSPIERQTR